MYFTDIPMFDALIVCFVFMQTVAHPGQDILEKDTVNLSGYFQDKDRLKKKKLAMSVLAIWVIVLLTVFTC